jgi:hypothetical protein
VSNWRYLQVIMGCGGREVESMIESEDSGYMRGKFEVERRRI